MIRYSAGKAFWQCNPEGGVAWNGKIPGGPVRGTRTVLIVRRCAETAHDDAFVAHLTIVTQSSAICFCFVSCLSTVSKA
ncbi:MAG TPA: hypothetical protein VF905_06150, partial [Nitrospirota bacterium]